MGSFLLGLNCAARVVNLYDSGCKFEKSEQEKVLLAFLG
jgi:hypothetical protein